MSRPEWLTYLLLSIDILVIAYGVRVIITEKKCYGLLLAIAFGLLALKEILSLMGVALSYVQSVIITVAAILCAISAFYLLVKSLPS